MPLPKDPVKREEWLRKNKELYQNPEWIRKHTEGVRKLVQDPEWIRKNIESLQKFHRDPEFRRKHKEGIRRRSQNPEWLRNVTEANRRHAQDPEWQRKNREAINKCKQDPEWQRKKRESLQERKQDPSFKRKQIEGIRRSYQDPERRRKVKEAAQKRAQDPEWQRKQKAAFQTRDTSFFKDPVYKENHKRGLQRRAKDPAWQIRLKEIHIGGFWYGNVTYKDPKYCELWCPNLWHRIDEAQHYQSILSGETKIDNGGRALSRHHIYWQSKACCKWDEDVGGYYAMINIGTRGKSNLHKYYIPGDPNRFVLLTMREHGMVARDKLKWIKIFEELIETKLGGICYLPKVEQISEPFLTGKINTT